MPLEVTATGENSKGRSSSKGLLLLFWLLAVAACSDETLSLFFDIPPPSEVELAARAAKEKAERAEAARVARGVAAIPAAVAEDEPRPAIEAVLEWERAEAMLPKDEMENVDWMAALRQGLIRPRTALPGAAAKEPAVFGYDFFLPGPEPIWDAYFPHSTHTMWLGCGSCHPRLFPKRGTEINMELIMEGKRCGACHGTVAFETDNCARCHPAMEEE